MNAPGGPARSVLERAIAGRVFSAASLEVGSSDGPLWSEALGLLSFESGARPASLETLFDLASLTKVIATTTVLMELVRTGRVRLEDPISKFFDEWRGADREGVTVRDLLEHASGLPARLVDAPPKGRREIEHDICLTPLEYAPRTKSIYSDLGFILLGFLAADRGGVSLPELFDQITARLKQIKVRLKPDTTYETQQPDSAYETLEPDSAYETLEPDSAYETLEPDTAYETLEPDTAYETLEPDTTHETDDREPKGAPAVVVSGFSRTVGIASLVFDPPPDSRAVAATTLPLADDPRRGRSLAGEVHDSYAAALGGAAGHSGLFGTAPAVGAFARTVLRAARGEVGLPPPFSPELVARFTAKSAVPGSSRALGWDTMLPTSSCGAAMSPGAFGHVGFTGTSLWIDPHRDRYFVLLTNRAGAGGSLEDMRTIRRAFHDALSAL